MKKIIPEQDLHDILLNVSLPGRYTGGEYGSIKKSGKHDYSMALCFPDLYEIGMSNQAVKILYREFNTLEGISCERVFAPDKDFEQELIDNDIPLYTLESGMPLYELDLLGITIGYELSATTILSILEAGKISIWNEERTDDEPLIIAGGPAITNPLPFGKFFDGVFIGEAEDAFSKVLVKLRESKQSGGKRNDALKIIEDSENIWTYRKHKKNIPAKRALWNGFATREKLEGIPVSNITTVQDNGIIEIMRGCPHNCRFCHAGFFYRPYRQKDVKDIIKEADFLINGCGYNEITLSSLSSGDYNGLSDLVKELNSRYGGKHISFSLPSLRINTFTLSLLQDLAIIRKSGLTFAVETPDPDWQRSINKEVTLERTVEILREAKKLGWKVAKFYFMVGLPVTGGSKMSEEEKIAEFIDTVQKATGMRLNVNVGTFIPKPHTPFQWSGQLTVEESYRKLTWLKAKFKRNPHVKLSYHTPFVSFLEGVISRGDERVGNLIYKAYKRGARLEAWSEYFDREIWTKVFSEADWDIESQTCLTKSPDCSLPWDTVDLGVNKKYIEYEYRKSQKNELTEGCKPDCRYKCGVCNDTVTPRNNSSEKLDKKSGVQIHHYPEILQPIKYIFKFIKVGKAVFLSHINIMNIFQKSLQRSSIDLEYSHGFNPKPKLEFAHPLSLGISSVAEIGSFIVLNAVEQNTKKCMEVLNGFLPEGIRVIDCKKLPPYVKGNKKRSLMSLYAGSRYKLRLKKRTSISIVKVKEDFERFLDIHKKNVEKTVYGDISLKITDDEESEKLEIFLPETNTKLSNIMYVLKEIYGLKECNELFYIERIALYASLNKGERIDYFSLL